ncbi:hypothetical protein [Aeromicrobium sp. Root495]|uniref:hypothetical protein n=1 Tax=Aeromicrobium sp. Root495 TaxID=1736550 RepID=UPI0012E95D35|nr:hypothetical protein [Aeromicrobium sp. Root495]
MMLEADPAGGDLGIRLKPAEGALPASPTVATLAAATRELRPDLVGSFAATVSEGLAVIPGFLTREHGRGMAGLWDALATACAMADVDVVVDVGRYDSASPAAALVSRADAVALVLRADPASVVHARELARQLAASGSSVVQPVVVTRERDATTDRADVDLIFASAAVPVRSSLHIAWDPTAVRSIESCQSPRGRTLARTKLVRSAQTIIDGLASSGVEVSEGVAT